MSVHRPILKSLVCRPSRRFITDDKRSYKGIELAIGACVVAEKLAERQRSKGIGLLLPTSGAFPIAALGAWMAGRHIVPFNYLLKPDELQYIVDHCQTDTLITVQPMLDYLDEAPKGPEIIRLEDLPFGKGIPPLRWPARAAADDLASILYTSGTSGLPKGVMLTHGAVRANIRQCIDWVKFSANETLLGVLPQFHSFGHTVLTWMPLTLGCKVIYSARFVPNQILRLIREHRPTAFIGVPSMYGALLRLKSATPEDFACFRYLVSGGEPLPRAVYDGFRERFGVIINEGYGLTETAPVINWRRPGDPGEFSVGRPLPDVHQQIIDPDTGAALPAGRDGEVRVKGPNIMSGYFRDKDATRAVFDERGAFRTGDIGRTDPDGTLWITGRLKEMIIVAGENVFPREIEDVLNTSPAVADSGAIGYTCPLRGEIPIAFVETAEDEQFDEQSLVGYCRQRLAGFKCPRRVFQVDELPRNPTGKVLRRELAAIAAEKMQDDQS